MSLAEPSPEDVPARARRGRRDAPAADRSTPMRLWYEAVRLTSTIATSTFGGIRAGGRHHVPGSGAALLVSNHLSYLDVFVLGMASPRPLNYVARSTLFLPVLGPLIRSVGGFPIQREGMGASGLKETLKRLRGGGVVALFPEGTRSLDGDLGDLKPGIAALAARARVPIVPAAIAGTFEAWPRADPLPTPHPIRIEFGPPIAPDQFDGRDAADLTALIRGRILACQAEARRGMARDLAGDSRPG